MGSKLLFDLKEVSNNKSSSYEIPISIEISRKGRI